MVTDSPVLSSPVHVHSTACTCRSCRNHPRAGGTCVPAQATTRLGHRPWWCATRSSSRNGSRPGSPQSLLEAFVGRFRSIAAFGVLLASIPLAGSACSGNDVTSGAGAAVASVTINGLADAIDVGATRQLSVVLRD